MSNTCSNCGAVVNDFDASCNQCGTPIQKTQNGGYCSSCGSPLAKKYAPCQNCGHVKTTFTPTPPRNPRYATVAYKDKGTVTILAVVLGIFGLSGIGHMYLGKAGKGVLILVANIALYVIGFSTLVFGIGVIFLIMSVVLFIWHVIDARNLCDQYNDHIHKHSNPPW